MIWRAYCEGMCTWNCLLAVPRGCMAAACGVQSLKAQAPPGSPPPSVAASPARAIAGHYTANRVVPGA